MKIHLGVEHVPLHLTPWIKCIVILYCFIYCPIHSLYVCMIFCKSEFTEEHNSLLPYTWFIVSVVHIFLLIFFFLRFNGICEVNKVCDDC